jgi:hypothetical protein
MEPIPIVVCMVALGAGLILAMMDNKFLSIALASVLVVIALGIDSQLPTSVRGVTFTIATICFIGGAYVTALTKQHKESQRRLPPRKYRR